VTQPEREKICAKITIPSMPPSLNRQGHWRKAHRLKRQWAQWIWTCLGFAQGRAFQRLADRKTKMRVSITLCNSREYDDDNKRYAEKIIYDALQQIAVIHRDSPEFVEREMKWEKCPHKQRHTIIHLEVA
jgi:hypothetical protein